MRIALVTHNILAKGDGQGVANYEFARHLVDNDHEVHLYANWIEPHLRKSVTFHRIRTVRKPLIIRAPVFLTIATLKLLYRKYDRILVDSGTYLGPYDFIGCHFCHKRYLKCKMRFYDTICEILSCWVERLQYKRRGVIIAVSHTLKHELTEELGIPEKRIRVIYNGVDLARFQWPKNEGHLPTGKAGKMKDGIPPTHNRSHPTHSTRRVTLLFVGDLSYRKGLDFLLEAMKGLDGNITLLIAGRARDRYVKLAKGLPVEFLGFVSDMTELLQKVDGFIFPSVYDPFGMAVLEAMAMGVPPIVSSLAGVSELVRDMENGIILEDPANISELRGKIAFFATHPELREKLGLQARITAENYSWTKMASERERMIRHGEKDS